jgi:hypothetical protein
MGPPLVAGLQPVLCFAGSHGSGGANANAKTAPTNAATIPAIPTIAAPVPGIVRRAKTTMSIPRIAWACGRA